MADLTVQTAHIAAHEGVPAEGKRVRERIGNREKQSVRKENRVEKSMKKKTISTVEFIKSLQSNRSSI